MLKNDAAVAVHDPFGRTRRARREQHPEGRVELDALCFQLRRFGYRLRPLDIHTAAARFVRQLVGERRSAKVRYVDGGPQRRQCAL